MTRAGPRNAAARRSARIAAARPGRPPKLVPEMLGDASVAITLGLYSHATPTMRREAANSLDAAAQGRRLTSVGFPIFSLVVLLLLVVLAGAAASRPAGRAYFTSRYQRDPMLRIALYVCPSSCLPPWPIGSSLADPSQDH